MIDRSINALRQELAGVLAANMPDTAERLEAVDWLLRTDPRAPYALVLKELTGATLQPDEARAIWAAALRLRREWSERLRESVSLSAAASEALSRHVRDEPAAPEGPSFRSYLERDLLTGLFLPCHYVRALREAVEEAERTGQPVSLALIDLDDTGRLNRELGHSPVDDLLRDLGQALRRVSRPGDVPCRCGGDEFAVVLPATPLASAMGIMQDLQRTVRDEVTDAPLALSIGVATYPTDARAAELLHEAAAAALIHARSRGSGQISTYFHDRGEFNEPLQNPPEPRGAIAAAGVGLILGVGLTVAGVGLAGFHRPPGPVAVPAPRPPRSRPLAVHPSLPLQPTPLEAAASTTAALAGTKMHAAETSCTVRRVTPEGVKGALPQNWGLAPGSPSNGTSSDPLEQAALPRLPGDYHRAEEQLRAMVSDPDPELGILALTAAACAEAADGKNPLEDFKEAAEKACHAPDKKRADLVARVLLARSDWYNRQGQAFLAEADLNQVLRTPCHSDLRLAAASRLVQGLERTHQNWMAADRARRLAAQQSEPVSRTLLRILAEDSLGHASAVLQLYRDQPVVTSLPDGVGEAAAEAIAEAAVPASRFDEAHWPELANSLVAASMAAGPAGNSQAGRRADSTVGSGAGECALRVALAERLLSAGAPGDAHRLLEPLLAQQDAAAQFLDGLALLRQGSPVSARQEWELLMAGQASPGSPDLWTPAPEEQWWVQSTAFVLGWESDSTYSLLLQRCGVPRQEEGRRYLQMARESNSSKQPG